MGLFLLILQVIAICGVIIALAVGLFSAPWYVLMGVLLLLLVIIQRLMPTSQWAFSSTQPSEVLVDGPQADEAPSGGSSSTRPSVLTYRGAHYSKNSQAGSSADPSHSTESDGGSHLTIPELKYRGVKIHPPS